MASTKRRCCCSNCNCNSCGPLPLPAALTVVVQGVTVVPCFNGTQGFGNPNGTFVFGCHQILQTTDCSWDTAAVPVSARTMTQSDCGGAVITNYPASYSNLYITSASDGAVLSIWAATSATLPHQTGTLFFRSFSQHSASCQFIIDGYTTNNVFTSATSGQSGYGGTATVSPHNPMP